MTLVSPFIRVEQLCRAYQAGDETFNALDSVSLSIARGEFVSIIGHSGSGKSTLMYILGCLDNPTKGRYWLDDNEVTNLGPSQLAKVRQTKIGFVFQNFSLLARTSAVENVEMPLIYAGTPRKERRKRAIAALERVGLGHRIHHLPNQLSGGQQQRVAIARALVGEPPLILADEPTGNLDSQTSIEVMNLFTRLNREQGVTVVIVTHEADIAEFGNRTIEVADGKVRADYATQAVSTAAEVPLT